MTTPFLIRTRTPTTSTPTPPSPPPLHFFAALSASVLPRLSRHTLQPPPSSSASATTSASAQPHALLQHRQTTDALDALQFMASLREPQISVTTTPTTTTTAPLPSIARALAFVPPAMGSSSSPPPAHLRRHPDLQLPPLVSLFAPPPPPQPHQRHAHVIDGLYPVQAQAQARPNHFCGGGGGGGPQLRPRAVPSVIHLKDQQQVPPTSGGQQPGPRRQRPLDWIDLTGNVEEEEEERCDKKKPQLPPFTSSQRGGTWCIRFGSADDGHKVGPTSSTTATSAETDDGEKRCAHCGTRSTPEWRRGPTGRGTLCNACGLKYTKTLQAQRRKGKTGSALGSVPLASLLNGPEDRKRRTSLSSPMVWQTTVKNFVSTPPSSTSTRSPSSPSSSSLLSASFPPAHLFDHACSLSSFSVSPPASSRDAGSPRKRARTQSLPNPPTHQ